MTDIITLEGKANRGKSTTLNLFINLIEQAYDIKYISGSNYLRGHLTAGIDRRLILEITKFRQNIVDTNFISKSVLNVPLSSIQRTFPFTLGINTYGDKWKALEKILDSFDGRNTMHCNPNSIKCDVIVTALNTNLKTNFLNYLTMHSGLIHQAAINKSYGAKAPYDIQNWQDCLNIHNAI